MHVPYGWVIYRITDHDTVNATLAEIFGQWTFGMIADAHARIDFYDRRRAREEAKHRGNST